MFIVTQDYKLRKKILIYRTKEKLKFLVQFLLSVSQGFRNYWYNLYHELLPSFVFNVGLSFVVRERVFKIYQTEHLSIRNFFLINTVSFIYISTILLNNSFKNSNILVLRRNNNVKNKPKKYCGTDYLTYDVCYV